MCTFFPIQLNWNPKVISQKKKNLECWIIIDDQILLMAWGFNFYKHASKSDTIDCQH